MQETKVLFTKNISSEGLVRIFEEMKTHLNGNVAIKISTGEPGGHNYLKPELIKDLVQKLKGTIVECNTAYKGKRFKTEDHLKAAKDHGFMDIADVDIMDSEGDIAIPVMGGRQLTENYVGKNLEKYDSILMLSHFKGHAMGGFGGALKNASIGIASAKGKTIIHTANKVNNPDELFNNLPKQDDFLEAMAEAAKSVADYKPNIVYINIMNNMSVDCDCDANPAPPKMGDIGILASLNPVALDQACVDLIYQSGDTGKKDLIERMESLNGIHIIKHAEDIGLGTKEYELVNID